MRVLMFGWEFPPHVSGGLGTACYGMTRALASRGTDILFVLPCLLSAPAETAGQHHKEQASPPPLESSASPPRAPAVTLQEASVGAGTTTLQGVGALSATPAMARPYVAPKPKPKPEEPVTDRHFRLLSASDVRTSSADFTQAARVSHEVNQELVPERWEERLKVQPVGSTLFAYATPKSYRQRHGDNNDEAHRVAATEARFERGAAFEDDGGAGTNRPDLGAFASASAAGGEGFSYGAGQPYILKGGYGPDLMTEVYRFGDAAGAIALRENFDVIHVHDWMTYPAGMAAKRLTGKPLVAHIHATEYDRSGKNINQEVARIEQAGMMAADRVVAVSHYTRELIMRRYGIPGDKISVVHNAVTRSEAPAAYHVPQGCENEKRVLFMGRVTYQKGPEYFVEAAHLVLRRMPGVRFVMAGSGD
ncbi:MAG: glycosyltransferase family 4 protein, partial [Bilophila sp.]